MSFTVTQGLTSEVTVYESGGRTETMVSCTGVVGDGGEALNVSPFGHGIDERLGDTRESEPCAYVSMSIAGCVYVNVPPDRMMSPDLTSLTASSAESQTLVFLGIGAFTTTE